MKLIYPLWMSGSFLGAAGLLLTFQPGNVPRGAISDMKDASIARTVDRNRKLPNQAQAGAEDRTLPSYGILWEGAGGSAVDAERASLPIHRKTFEAIRKTKTGGRIQLDFSPHIPALDSEVVQRAVQADGTVLTHLIIPGDPEGNLIIQENEAADFFLGQLYYRNHPVAYEFKETNRGLTATRHPVSDLICSIVSPDQKNVMMGLPGAGVTEAPGNGKGGGNGGGGNGGGGNGGGGGNDGGGDTRTISISDVSTVEGTGGSQTLDFILSLSSRDKKNDITVEYTTSDGSATAPSDYSASSGTVVFPRRSTQATISIPVTTDAIFEADETLTITLSNPAGATISNGTATGTILNDDLAPSLSVADLQVTEGDSGSTSANITVELSPAATSTVTVDYTTNDGTATDGVDYLGTSGSLIFQTGETSKVVGVEILGDTDFEDSETFSFVLSNATGAPIGDGQADCLILNDDADPFGVPILNSLPGAAAVALLDMDGHVCSGTSWNAAFTGGEDIVARGVIETLGETGMINVWKRVAEDFAPFEINVTTDESVYLATPASMRTHCVITPDNEWFGTAGGVAYLGSFTWTGDTPCWTFSDQLANSARYIAEASSHEIGHTLDLRHDGRIDPAEEYYSGHGSGATGWAPIMGVGYYKSLVQWSRGEYLSANNTEDDLAIITGFNGFGYRTDDHANTSGSASSLEVNGLSLAGSGLIGSQNDTDVFSFTVSNTGTVDLAVQSDSLSPNLDILAEVRDGNGTVVASDNDPELLGANLVAVLDPGTYYLYVTGTGKGDPEGTGYPDYGSLGPYTIAGQMP